MDGKLIDPSSYMKDNMVVMKEFDVKTRGLDGISVASGSVEEMQDNIDRMDRAKGKVKRVKHEDGEEVG